MPFMDAANLRLHYRIDGRDDAPCLVLSNSLGTNFDMWTPQMPALIEHFRVIRYDTRGHGKSSVPGGPYSIEQLGNDVVALLDHLEIERTHFCGLSMGGMTGIWLGIHRPERIDRLVLCNTSAQIGSAELWNARIDKVKQEGMASIVPAVIDRWFTSDFQRTAPVQVNLVRDMLLGASPEGYVGNCAAVRDMDERANVHRISAPTLVIAGRFDLATPAAEGKRVADSIAGARYVELNAAHLSNWEAAQAFTTQVVDFLRQGSHG
ncbi:3-oxoadipate enol-lactonase [Herbaspirillum sp. ST 5-3]|uniref:3-oxoadipate enol-lactonase n=1 Tax=Oxalobacteraceae TaxID=75682 RepID=UPI0010A30A73|nr:3-oxoadipate enol-lactonase [Herbaspirillum sp. ST 5-3]